MFNLDASREILNSPPQQWTVPYPPQGFQLIRNEVIEAIDELLHFLEGKVIPQWPEIEMSANRLRTLRGAAHE